MAWLGFRVWRSFKWWYQESSWLNSLCKFYTKFILKGLLWQQWMFALLVKRQLNENSGIDWCFTTVKIERHFYTSKTSKPHKIKLKLNNNKTCWIWWWALFQDWGGRGSLVYIASLGPGRISKKHCLKNKTNKHRNKTNQAKWNRERLQYVLIYWASYLTTLYIVWPSLML